MIIYPNCNDVTLKVIHVVIKSLPLKLHKLIAMLIMSNT